MGWNWTSSESPSDACVLENLLNSVGSEVKEEMKSENYELKIYA